MSWLMFPTLRCLALQGELYGDCVRVNSSSEECLVYGGGWGQCAALDQFTSSSTGKLRKRFVKAYSSLHPNPVAARLAVHV